MPVPPTVAVDIDGCLAHYHGWAGHDNIGKLFKGAAAFTRKLHAEGFFVLLYSTRCKGDVFGDYYNPLKLAEQVKQWATTHEIYFDEVYIGQGKPPAVAYVDDRAVQVFPPAYLNDADPWAYAIEQCRYLRDRPNQQEEA